MTGIGSHSGEQAETIAFLSDPRSHGTDGPVDLIETHAAIVFLAGQRAYKLKKAVTYPFLDYGTPELRRESCEAELALNRRTAPGLYLEVRAVRRGANGRLGFEHGDPVDWVVVMRRFDQHDLFDRLAAEGTLTLDRLRPLTDRIAQFHADAEVVRSRGGAAAMRRILDGNRESMAAVASIIAASEADALHRASVDALSALGPLLDRRRDEGHVRRCHGDLHLRNICLVDGVPTLFDCIEFSDEIACIDVLYDLAFLLMDLWQRGLRPEANFVFNRYLDMTDESDGLAAIPLFMSMRAAVRAHVSALAAGAQADAGARRREEEAARSYLALAADLLRPVAPRLVAIGGFSGTGKSTLGRALAPDLGGAPGARVLRSDVIRKRLMQVAPETRLPESAYRIEASNAVYAEIDRRAEEVLDAGMAAVADAVFAQPDERRSIAEVAARRGAAFTGFWLEAPLAVLASRLAARIGDASDATGEVARRQLGYRTGTIEWHRIDASGDPAATAAAALAILDS
ncbi:MAG: AAA family ATPase [Sphingomonadales bacterium]